MDDDKKKEVLMRSRGLTKKVLEDMSTWRRLPKKERDSVITAIHIGRQVETDMGYVKNAGACLKAIHILEGVSEIDVDDVDAISEAFLKAYG